MPTDTDQELADDLYNSLTRIVRSLRRAHASTTQASSQLGPSSSSALVTIYRNGQIKSGDLAKFEGVTAATMSRILTALTDDGYIKRVRDTNDGRVVLLTATKKGERAYRELLDIRADLVRRRIDSMTPDERATLQAALPALNALAFDDEIG